MKKILLLVTVVMSSLAFTSCLEEQKTTISVKNLSVQYLYEETDLNVYELVLLGYIGNDLVEQIYIQDKLNYGQTSKSTEFVGNIEKVRIGVKFKFLNPNVEIVYFYSNQYYYLERGEHNEFRIDQNTIFTRHLNKHKIFNTTL